MRVKIYGVNLLYLGTDSCYDGVQTTGYENVMWLDRML